MRSSGRKIFLIAGLLVFGAAAGVARAGLEDTVRKSFEVAPGGQLRVSTAVGSIRVRSGAANRVEVEIVRKSRTDDASRFAELLGDYTFDLSQTGNDVDVRVTRDRRSRDDWKGWNSGLNLEFSIVVPDVYNVDLKTSGGSVEVDDLRGRVVAETSGGSLRFGRILGEVEGRTSGGSIVLEETGGNADVRTSGGSISIGRAEGDVVAKTSGGSIRVEEVMGSIEASTSGGSVSARIGSQPKADCSLSTSGGSVTVELAPSVSVALDAETSSGRVISDIPVSGADRVEKRSLRGDINGGGPSLRLRTSGGNIHVKPLR